MITWKAAAAFLICATAWLGCCPISKQLPCNPCPNAIVAGPMLGYAEHMEARVWLEATGNNFQLQYRTDSTEYQTAHRDSLPSINGATVYHFTLQQLQPGTQYSYRILSGDLVLDSNRTLTTRHTWEHVYTGDTLRFLLGSCAYINDEPDTSGNAYGQSTSIFETMGREQAAFMIWLGDNTYLREAEWTSTSGIQHRFQKDRSLPVLQPLLASMNHYAIWDDHDYGPNDGDASYALKYAALETFKKYWGNKSYGDGGGGIYSKFEVEDAEFYLLDDRYFRSPNGVDNDSPDKHFLGTEQLAWLKQSLLGSPRRFNFRFICIGNQVLNPVNEYECYTHFEREWQELMDFIVEHRIPGVIFLSGDRHLTEINRYQPKNFYALHDVTSSPLTSRPFRTVTEKAEYNNPARVPGSLYTEQTYMRVSLSGSYELNKRAATFEVMDKAGAVHWSYTLTEEDLRPPVDSAVLKGMK